MARRNVILGSILAALAVVGGGTAWPGSSRTLGLGAGAASSRAAADSLARFETELLDRDIAFFSQRAARDPESAAERAYLSARYLTRARETGSYEDNRRAEEAARQSLALRSVRNDAVYGILASSLLAQHRFGEALAAAHELVRADSTALGSLALLGETYLELGLYDSARVVFGQLGSRRTLAVAPGLARWAEISGHLDQARRIFADAAREAWREPELRREQLAWFELRVGELSLKRGMLAEADRAFRRGLSVRPSDHRLLAALARLELLRGRPKAAIEAGERAIGVVVEPATLGTVADAYAALGDSAMAADYGRALEVATASQPGAFHRGVGLYLLDHGRNVAQVLAKARDEIRSRQDVYGYDLLAWALYRSGDLAGSRAAIDRALALGTEDATLLFHAAAIELAWADRRGAVDHLERALALNPYFHPTLAPRARALLDSLERIGGSR